MFIERLFVESVMLFNKIQKLQNYTGNVQKGTCTGNIVMGQKSAINSILFSQTFCCDIILKLIYIRDLHEASEKMLRLKKFTTHIY